MAGKKFTTKQQKFIDCYDGNATKAAIAAGYSKKTAYAIGEENLRKPEILEAIQKREAPKSKLLIWNREQRQAFWTQIANDTSKITSDRLRASELLGKSQADFTEKVEHSGQVNSQVQVVLTLPKNGSEKDK